MRKIAKIHAFNKRKKRKKKILRFVCLLFMQWYALVYVCRSMFVFFFSLSCYFNKRARVQQINKTAREREKEPVIVGKINVPNTQSNPSTPM